MAPYSIVTAAEVRSIFERAMNYLEELEAEEEIDHHDREARRAHAIALEHVVEAARFCVLAAAGLRDPSLADLVFETMDLFDRFEDRPDHNRDLVVEAIQELLRAGLPPDKRIAELARSERPERRRAVAVGLVPHSSAARAILMTLAADPAVEVRSAAKKSLAAVIEVPWWSGKWASDPAARLLPHEAESAGPALRRINELIELPHYHLLNSGQPHLTELCAELQKLPDALAVEAIEHFLSSTERFYRDAARPLFLALFDRPGGAEAFVRLLQKWGSAERASMYNTELSNAVKAAPMEPRLALCRRLLTMIASAPLARRTRFGESPEWLAASVVGKAWPPGADPTPVMEVLLALGEDPPDRPGLDHVRNALSDAIEINGVEPGPWLDRICEARVAGYPGVWRPIGRSVDRLLSRAPRDVLRRTAERALQTEDQDTLQWAMLQLLGPSHDAEKDGPQLARVKVMLSEPRLRPAFMAHYELVHRGLPLLREELRRGELLYTDAVKVFEAIDRLYGGLADPDITARTTEKTMLADQQKRRDEIDPFLGPEELRGPPVEQEWAALGRARDAFTGDDDDRVRHWVRTLRAGPWTADERAQLDAYLEESRSADNDYLLFMLGRALAAKPESALLDHYDELIERGDADTRSQLKYYRGNARTALGLDPVPSGESDAAPADSEHDDDDGEESDDDLPDGDDWDDDDEDQESH